jgi:formylmethanofuran dehydrogenase subunit E
MSPALFLLACLSPYGADGSPESPALELPKPHFQQRPGDPPWLAQVAQFHGHLGPSVVAGTRFGMAGLRAVGAHGFFDVEVTCEGPFAKPPQSCFLDGLQVGTGATLGKRSIIWTPADEVLVRVKNTRTGKVVELHPTTRLLELVAFLKPPATNVESKEEGHKHENEASVEALARKIAAIPDSEIIVLCPGGVNHMPGTQP